MNLSILNSASSTVNQAYQAITNNPRKTAAAVVLTVAGGVAAYQNTSTISDVAQKVYCEASTVMENLANQASSVAREAGEYLGLLTPAPVKETVVPAFSNLFGYWV
ncbi:MAG: hypothetical protein S4CHLAM7_09580 [Chlamydiae bacterium]|nr:hypothetical protein [Chlamydiota bacterium]